MRIRSRAGALLLIGLLPLLAGCGRVDAGRALGSNQDVTVTLAVDPAAPQTGLPSTLTITIAGQDGRPIDGARIEVEGDMTHAGMMPVTTTAAPAGSGRYAASLTWTMAGDWVVTVKAALADGRTVERAFPVRVGAGGQ